eukprot:TRINITY_DN6095_c0_g1_i2.p2 TRINITY_DN6095_c0_g1~~TRINITY_DN6095_c0_g1_i2.p2  ORF type:complete len:126 (+),score=11.77 TRINITY_DN6095_c0_g1_i2:1-378(+)
MLRIDHRFTLAQIYLSKLGEIVGVVICGAYLVALQINDGNRCLQCDTVQNNLPYFIVFGFFETLSQIYVLQRFRKYMTLEKYDVYRLNMYDFFVVFVILVMFAFSFGFQFGQVLDLKVLQVLLCE